MPRTNQLAEPEFTICERLKVARLATGLTRVVFSSQCSFNYATLANIEHKRIALRYGVARQVIRSFGVNPHWLGMGENPMITALPAEFDLQVFGKDELLFSEVYSAGLGKALDKATEAEDRVSAVVRHAFLADKSDPSHISKIPPETKDAMLRQLAEQCNRLIMARMQTSLLRPELNLFLAHGASYDTKRGMPSSILKDLTARAKRLTEGRGQRSGLARLLGVPRQRVAQWFGGVSAPNAEDALRLSVWVSEEEKKEKSAGRGETRPAPKTRKSKSTANEKAKPSRRKR